MPTKLLNEAQQRSYSIILAKDEEVPPALNEACDRPPDPGNPE
jgi:hypothetical protein